MGGMSWTGKLMSRSETTRAMRFGEEGRETEARRSRKGDVLGRRSSRYLRSAWIGWFFYRRIGMSGKPMKGRDDDLRRWRSGRRCSSTHMDRFPFRQP